MEGCVLNMKPLYELFIRRAEPKRRERVEEVLRALPEKVDVSGLARDEPWLRGVDIDRAVRKGLPVREGYASLGPQYILLLCPTLAVAFEVYNSMRRMALITIVYLEEVRLKWPKMAYYPCLKIKYEKGARDIVELDEFLIDAPELARLVLEKHGLCPFSPRALSSAMILVASREEE